MSLPNAHTFNTADLTAYTPSCGTSPVAAYIRAPFRCVTASDGTVVVSVNANSIASFAVPQSGSAAGQLFSVIPPSPTYLNEDDVIVLTPSGASGASIPMHFSAVVKAA